MVSSTHSIIFDTGEPAYAVDRNGVIVAWNAAAKTAFGHSDTEAVGRNCWDLLQGQDTFGNQYCCERCPLREMAFHHKSVNRCRIYFRTADNELKRFIVSTLVLFNEHGQETLIHLCRPEAGANKDTSTIAPMRKPGVVNEHNVLTPRENQVLYLLSEGHTTREIATLMSISGPTVRNHVEHILHKLHTHSRLEAVAVGRRLGLVSESTNRAYSSPI